MSSNESDSEKGNKRELTANEKSRVAETSESDPRPSEGESSSSGGDSDE